VKPVSLIHYTSVKISIVSQLEKGEVNFCQNLYEWRNTFAFLINEKRHELKKIPITTLFSRERTFDIDFSLIVQQAKVAWVCRFPSLR